MDKKIVIIAAVSTGTIALAAAGAYCLPYLTLNSMKTAAANRNADALSREIDFPSLRNSLKENIKLQVMKQMTGTGANIVPGMNPELVDKMVNPMVDKMVTPEGLAELMQDKVPGAKIDLSNLEQNIAASEIKMGYESVDRFVVHISDKADVAKDVSLILKRDGLVWKLSGIDISKV